MSRKYPRKYLKTSQKLNEYKILKEPLRFQIQYFDIIIIYRDIAVDPTVDLPQEYIQAIQIFIQNKEEKRYYASVNAFDDLPFETVEVFGNMYSLYEFLVNNCKKDCVKISQKGTILISYRSGKIIEEIKVENHPYQLGIKSFQTLWKTVMGIWDQTIKNNIEESKQADNIEQQRKEISRISYPSIMPQLVNEEQSNELLFKKKKQSKQAIEIDSESQEQLNKPHTPRRSEAHQIKKKYRQRYPPHLNNPDYDFAYKQRRNNRRMRNQMFDYEEQNDMYDYRRERFYQLPKYSHHNMMPRNRYHRTQYEDQGDLLDNIMDLKQSLPTLTEIERSTQRIVNQFLVSNLQNNFNQLQCIMEQLTKLIKQFHKNHNSDKNDKASFNNMKKATNMLIKAEPNRYRGGKAESLVTQHSRLLINDIGYTEFFNEVNSELQLQGQDLTFLKCQCIETWKGFNRQVAQNFKMRSVTTIAVDQRKTHAKFENSTDEGEIARKLLDIKEYEKLVEKQLIQKRQERIMKQIDSRMRKKNNGFNDYESIMSKRQRIGKRIMEKNRLRNLKLQRMSSESSDQ